MAEGGSAEKYFLPAENMGTSTAKTTGAGGLVGGCLTPFSFGAPLFYFSHLRHMLR